MYWREYGENTEPELRYTYWLKVLHGSRIFYVANIAYEMFLLTWACTRTRNHAEHICRRFFKAQWPRGCQNGVKSALDSFKKFE